MRNWGWALLAVILLALLAGVLLGERGRDDPRRQAEADVIRQEAARRAAEADYFLPLRIAFYAGLAVVGVGAAGLGAWAGYLYLRRRATTIYPDHNGVLPAVVLPPGEVLVDAGALAGPLAYTGPAPRYQLPEDAIAQLQAGANQGAALTRTMRAWATRAPATRGPEAAPPWTAPRPALPPVQVLTGDEDHIYRLLEEQEA